MLLDRGLSGSEELGDLCVLNGEEVVLVSMEIRDGLMG